MASPPPIPEFDAARVLLSVTCSDCQGEGSRLLQGTVNLPRDSDAPLIGFHPCERCDKTGRIQLEIPLEQFRHLLTPPPSLEAE